MKEVKSFFNIVGMDCPAGKESELDTWYNETHIPLLLELKFEGLRNVTRYRIASASGSDLYRANEAYPKFLAILEWESRQAFEGYETSPKRTALIEDTQQIMKSTGAKVMWRVQYDPIGTWRR